MLRQMRMCCPIGLLFSPKVFTQRGSTSAKKWKTSPLWGRKTLKNGAQLAKILENIFEGEKSFDMRRDFRSRIPHSLKNDSSPRPLPQGELLLTNIWGVIIPLDILVSGLCKKGKLQWRCFLLQCGKNAITVQSNLPCMTFKMAPTVIAWHSGLTET